jgi:hypothetical protein
VAGLGQGFPERVELKKEFEDFKKDDKVWDKEKIRAHNRNLYGFYTTLAQ